MGRKIVILKKKKRLVLSDKGCVCGGIYLFIFLKKLLNYVEAGVLDSVKFLTTKCLTNLFCWYGSGNPPDFNVE